MAAGLLPLLVGLMCLALVQPSAAGWADAAHERACQQQGGVASFGDAKPIVADPAACTSAYCFQYRLSCKKGAPHDLTSRYRPQASAADVFFYTHGLWLKALIVAAIVAFAVIAAFGDTKRASALKRHGIYAAVFTVPILMWGVGAKHDTDFFDSTVFAIIRYLVFPVYIVYYSTAFLQGWNYLFVRHPVTATIIPAVRTGEAIDTASVAQTLTEGASDEGSKPAYHYEHQAQKAAEVLEQLERDTAVAEAALKRERARADLAEAEAELTQRQRRKSLSTDEGIRPRHGGVNG
jgi:hypothetical protein